MTKNEALMMVREQADIVYSTKKNSKEWPLEMQKLDRMAYKLHRAGVDAYEVEAIIIKAWEYKG